MTGRHRDSKGIKYPFTFEESKLSKTMKWEFNLDKDLENGYNIIVLSHQPGIGKTYKALEYMESHPNTFYFTDRHRAIDEHTSNWEKNKIEYSHWRGFPNICQTEDVNDLYKKYHLGPGDIFQNCTWRTKKIDEDEYSKQFENDKRIFAPFNYLNSKRFLEKDPDILFIDERISNLEKYKLNQTNLIRFLEMAKATSDYIKNAEEGNCWYFLGEGVKESIKGNYVDDVIKAKEHGDGERLRELSAFNPNNFFNYLYWGRIYGYNSDIYSCPQYYYALDALIRGIPLVILDASFNPYLFHYFLETYNGETQKLGKPGFSKTEVNVKICYSNRINSESKIYRMRPNGAWGRGSIVGSWKARTKEWVSRDMRSIMNVFGTSNVGLISFKDYGEVCQNLGFDMEYFGSLRGTNILEDKFVLVVLGGWFPPPPSWSIPENERKKNVDYLEDIVWNYFMIKINKEDTSDVLVGAPYDIECQYKSIKNGVARVTSDKEQKEEGTLADIAEKNPISMINVLFCDEVYQAFHRNRPLRYPRLIFAYGWFPEPKAVHHSIKKSKKQDERVEKFIDYSLREEFGGNVEKIYNHWISEEKYKSDKYFFEWLETEYSLGKIQRIINEFEKGDIRGVSPSPTDIANKYKIWKGSGKGPDNNFVEEFEKWYTELKERAKEKK